MSPNEEKFNAVLAGLCWTSSGFIALAMLSNLLGVQYPDVMVNAFKAVVSWTIPLFMTVALYQVWRLPDWRRYIAIPASLLLIVSGALMFEQIAADAAKKQTQDTIAVVHNSVAWKTAEAEYNAVLTDYNQLAGRKFTSDYATEFRKNEEAKKEKWAKVEEKSKALKDLEPAVTVNVHGPFDFLGKEWAGLIQSVFLIVYAVVNEAASLALSHRPTVKQPKKQEEKAEDPKKEFTVDDYIEAAKRLGTNGTLAGYRIVAMDTKQTEYLCKMLLKEAISQGKIRVKTGARQASETKEGGES
ncbi:hypothetical protein [Tetrasphaera phage TJE1]|uniref:Uncharacterized protein n=1 Tax=Tetrasphaera phage TJE1 TaxID=981335 RepID=G4W938_9CAUD|nr:hypothetical protein G185_gp14 [Tetrasphaera phage TJE1]ADX42526.1 hypothetical protein [Tetrasphaera phage TJE1]